MLDFVDPRGSVVAGCERAVHASARPRANSRWLVVEQLSPARLGSSAHLRAALERECTACSARCMRSLLPEHRLPTP